MKRDVQSPEEYLATIPEAQRPLVDHLRRLVRTTAPGLPETIRWGMLSYGEPSLFALAAQKQYVALYVMATAAVDGMAEALAGVDHGKGCLRFKEFDDVPTGTIRKLLGRARDLREEERRVELVAHERASRTAASLRSPVAGA